MNRSLAIAASVTAAVLAAGSLGSVGLAADGHHYQPTHLSKVADPPPPESPGPPDTGEGSGGMTCCFG